MVLLIFLGSLIGFVGSHILMKPSDVSASSDLLSPAPTQPVGYFDLFGELLSPKQAALQVREQGLDIRDPVSYQRIGAVRITQELIDAGEDIFFNRRLGDTFGLQRVFGFGTGLQLILPDVLTAIEDLQGQPTTNLRITLSQAITLGSQTFPAGTVIDTGLDVVKGAAGEAAVGPFAGLSSLNNAVHYSEINILGNWKLIAQTLDIDPEVYLGVVLQNAFDPSIRLPEGAPVKPSEWLRQVAPDPNQAELEDQIPAPGTGTLALVPSGGIQYNTVRISSKHCWEWHTPCWRWQRSISPI